MLGFRKIQKAEISSENRRRFERCGVVTVQLTLASGHWPASEDLGRIYSNYEKARSEAEAWLIEQADKQANHEWRVELVEWAVLIFVVMGVIVDTLLLFHSK